MSTTVTMWLGIAFVALGVIATILQAWLWSFPMLPDPGGPDPNGLSTAPRRWTMMHRLCGALYVVIYIVLMWEMVPRLWEYQVELPARTIMHAVMGITIGVLLVGKIAIIRWFQHFGKALPTFGFLLLLCTLILAALSLPHALRAHDYGNLTPEAIAKTRDTLNDEAAWIANSKVDDAARKGFVQYALDDVSNAPALRSGQEILAEKCTTCHDLKTVMEKPKKPNGWYKTVLRMAEKPSYGDAITDDDIPLVAAYLVHISSPLRRQKIEKKRDEIKEVKAREQAAKAAGPIFDPTTVKPVFEDICTGCHELDLIEAYGQHDAEGWRSLVTTMVEEEGAELTPEEFENIVRYLAATKGSD